MEANKNKGTVSGFTLIELMVVIAIVGILAAIAIPDIMKRGPHFRLISASGALQGDLEFAQARALKYNATHCFIIDSPQQYRIVWDCNQDQSCDSADETRCGELNDHYIVVNGAFEQDGQERYFPGISFAADSATGEYHFLPNGSVVTDAGVIPSAPIVFKLQSVSVGTDTPEEKADLKLYLTGAVDASGLYAP